MTEQEVELAGFKKHYKKERISVVDIGSNAKIRTVEVQTFQNQDKVVYSIYGEFYAEIGIYDRIYSIVKFITGRQSMWHYYVVKVESIEDIKLAHHFADKFFWKTSKNTQS